MLSAISLSDRQMGASWTRMQESVFYPQLTNARHGLRANDAHVCGGFANNIS